MAIILLYHRVAVTAADPWALNVSPLHFRQHLEVLRAGYHVMALEELAATRGRTHADAVAITFDDGYADNLCEALPLLEHYEMPATFYLATDSLDDRAEFWWDELEGLILEQEVLPERLNLVVDGRPFACNLGTTARLTDQDRAHSNGWVAWRPGPTARHSLYSDIWALLQQLSPSSRHRAMAALRAWAESPQLRRASHRTLTNAEACRLGASELATLGAHTRSHPRLSGLDEPDQWAEIDGSARTLAPLAGSSIRSFSYPFGKPADYTTTTIDLVRRAGFDSAVCNVPGAVSGSTDPFQLPRFFVEDLTGEAFADWLRQVRG